MVKNWGLDHSGGRTSLKFAARTTCPISPIGNRWQFCHSPRRLLRARWDPLNVAESCWSLLKPPPPTGNWASVATFTDS